MTGDIVQDVLARAGADYEVILADPPWKFSGGTKGRPQHYPRMSLKAIRDIPVRGMVAKEAALFMWITTPLLAVGAHIPIMRAWGFEPTAVAFTWIKTRRGTSWPHLMPGIDLHTGMGLTTLKNAEIVMLGKRGRSLRVKPVHEIVISPVRQHSRKPPEIAERIHEYVGPGRRMVELFSRETSPGFEPLGNEVAKFDWKLVA